MFGSMQVTVRDGDEAPAQPSGIRIGMRRDRPSSLRPVPAAGHEDCRVVQRCAGPVAGNACGRRRGDDPATTRLQAWGPVVRHGLDISVAPPGAGFPPPGTPHSPVLVVDDRPIEVGGLGDAGPWQCRLDIRAVTSASDLGAIGHADVLVFGQVSSAVASALATMMGLDTSLVGQLSALGPGCDRARLTRCH